MGALGCAQNKPANASMVQLLDLGELGESETHFPSKYILELFKTGTVIKQNLEWTMRMWSRQPAGKS